MKNAYLYWIRLLEHTDIATQGYVGVTKDITKRFKDHMKECSANIHANPHLTHAYHKYGEQSFIVDLIYHGNENECYIKETELRNAGNIGWNIAPGGHRGPGRAKGSLAQHRVTVNNALKKKERENRIASGNPTEEDLIFLDKKKERKILTELAREERLRINQLAKEQRSAIRNRGKQEKKKKKDELKLRDATGALRSQPTRPICTHCKFALAKPNGKSKHGFQQWHKYCTDCAKTMYSGRFKHLQHKGNVCEECNFVPEDRIQLDLVYIDGNKNNKKKNNLLTLCANCARLHNKKIRTGNKSILNATVDGDTRIS